MIDAVLMIEPPPASSMCRAASREHRNTDVMLRSTTFCQRSRPSSSVGSAADIPALLIRMSIVPNASIVPPTKAFAPASVETSALTPTAPAPSSSATRSATAGSRELIATFAPSVRKARATANPMPRLDPLIAATLPSRRPLI